MTYDHINGHMDKVDRPKKNGYAADIYTRDEALLMFEKIKDENIYIPIIIATYYGFRRSEVLGLRWQAIDFENKRISVNHKAVEEKVNGKTTVVGHDELKTKASRRTLLLIPKVEEILKTEKARQDEFRKLFGSEYHKERQNYICVDAVGHLFKPNYLSTKFRKLLLKYGLRKIRLHDLRHTCASLLINEGVNMKEVQAWMGHSNFSTTADIYAHLDARGKEDSARVIESLL